MQSNVKVSVEKITPNQAKAYLKTNLLTQRHVDGTWSRKLAKMMELKQFDGLNGETIKFKKNGKGWVLIDGQHRLNAVIQYGKPVSMIVMRGVSDSGFKTLDQGKNRSIENFYQIANQSYAKVCSQVAKWLYYMEYGGGHPLVWKGGTHNRPIPGVIADWALKEHEDLPKIVEPIHDYLNSFQKKGLGTKNQLAFCYYLWQKDDPLMAYDVGKYLATGDGDIPQTIKSLREYLITLGNATRIGNTIPGTMRGAMVINALNTGWNYTRNGRKNIRSFKKIVSKFEKSFAGTRSGHGTGAKPSLPGETAMRQTDLKAAAARVLERS